MRSVGEDSFCRRLEAGLIGETLDGQEVARPLRSGLTSSEGAGFVLLEQKLTSTERERPQLVRGPHV